MKIEMAGKGKLKYTNNEQHRKSRNWFEKEEVGSYKKKNELIKQMKFQNES